jgi:hypothetical protein
MDTVRDKFEKLGRKGQSFVEKTKNIVRPHTPGPTASSRESLGAHSASPSSRPRASVDPTAGERGTISGGTTSPINPVLRPTPQLRVEHEGLDTEISKPQSLSDATTSKQTYFECDIIHY